MRAHRFRPQAGPALAVVLVLAGGGLSACAADDEATAPELEVEVPDLRGAEDPDDPYIGLLDAAFREDLEAYARQEVTLLADVAEVLSPQAFTVTSPEGGEVDPVLVVTTVGDADPRAGQPLYIAATPVRDFQADVVIEELGLDVDPDELEDWEDETFLVATILESAS
ncbi:hypothetical protein FHU33_2023 [Blastococcus colisei]|uniref:Lipoprotein n=1 Tax=Blastococcus colisei TaxID=1564162 RepID=A0A543PEY3_9ACTN|nr:hypothetical protein [Blastococcus colisei]TQN42617.1 hypothetical protein FHU33_2023 [Blastococcus colisei]